MKTQSKLIVILSDLHIGSTVGLWPTGFVSNEGNPIGQNKFQEWLWECWCDAMQWSRKIIGKDAFDLVLNGDLVDGIHHKTLQVMTPDPGDQTSAVLQTLSGLGLQWSKLHVIKGTEAHSRNDEIRIGQALGGTRNPQTGQHAWDNLDLDVHGCLYNFAHHISATARTYLEASAHSIMLGNLTHARARAGKPVPQVMVRAHRHRHGIWQDGNQISMITGAWQGLTRYGYKVVPDAIPQPSMIITDHRQAEKGDLPLIHSRVYTAD
jgi:hypothetical protein